MYTKSLVDQLDANAVRDVMTLRAHWTPDTILLAAWRLGNMRGRQWFKRPGGNLNDIKQLLVKHEATNLEAMRGSGWMGTRAIDYGEREALVIQGFARVFPTAPELAAYFYGKEAKKARYEQELLQLLRFFLAVEEHKEARVHLGRTTDQLKAAFDAISDQIQAKET